MSPIDDAPPVVAVAESSGIDVVGGWAVLTCSSGVFFGSCVLRIGRIDQVAPKQDENSR
jgi:hypothetical protein